MDPTGLEPVSSSLQMKCSTNWTMGPHAMDTVRNNSLSTKIKVRKTQTQNKSGNVYSNNHSSLVNEYFTQVHPEGDGADPDKEIEDYVRFAPTCTQISVK